MHLVTIRYPSGRPLDFPSGIKVSEAIAGFGPLERPLAAVLVNNELQSLDAHVLTNCAMEPITIDSAQGAFSYRRSLCFLAAIAARDLFPERDLVVGQAIGYGFYHRFQDGPIAEADIAALERRMRELVAEDIPVAMQWWSYEEALAYFRDHGQEDTLLLLELTNEPKIALNECAGFRDLHVTPLVPSTGVLRTFELRPYDEGFLLRYPRKEKPDEIPAFEDDPLLYKITDDSRRRSGVLGVDSVGALNRLAAPKRIKDYITVAESLMTKTVAEIADQVAARRDTVKVVLIAGPSSSGKTTTSKKLSIQLRVLGFEPMVIGLDDYFVDRTRTPRDENGEFDFECLEALDVEYLNEQLLQLFAGEEVELPAFDFKTGERKPSGKRLRLGERTILIMEGIHGLNDRLTPRIPRDQKFKIYVSALTQINLDEHNRISTTDNRLIRRMVRDNQFRGRSARDTIRMWPSVQRGERLHIFPFQNGADAALNSALDYELGVLKVYAEPLLRSVKPMDPEYCEAKRLLNFLAFFAPIPAQYVPQDSLVREFIGESSFKY
ncbi:MAG TPA: nucleoside kinase [Spirochaetia bacterium]|nr:nucleoside kinase [Spirochaetales bacterium]HRW25332.1 nucleoside kinase [Spirochaetia bacterium]